MTTHLVEYVWLDGYTPEPTLRSKVKAVTIDDSDEEAMGFQQMFGGDSSQLELKQVPEWGFDGSSTQQAEGHDSDCLLKPVRLYQSPFRDVNFFVICEVLNVDGTPHKSNSRHDLTEALVSGNSDGEEWWFGFEQEFLFMKDGRPLGFPKDAGFGAFPKPQGDYYCGLGITGRAIANAHMQACIIAGIDISGTNAEVLLGQWEFQCFGKGALKAADDLWMARYILGRLAEDYEMTIDRSPKPLQGDWNGNGMHTNFSNAAMRDVGGKTLFDEVCHKLAVNHHFHIEVYGSGNDQRLTGDHETQIITEFNYGVSDRGASVRIPIATVNNSWMGYLEDRRPAANADSYKVVQAIFETVAGK